MKGKHYILNIAMILMIVSCQKDVGSSDQTEVLEMDVTNTGDTNTFEDGQQEIGVNAISGLEVGYDYANQAIPNYIDKDNIRGNEITDAGATLGRVMFYDKKLSVNNSISCASCHKQELAFGDNRRLSQGVNGETGKHSMRLINARFFDERRFFWDERADNLEQQTTMPIQDHIEMGFSGTDGNPGINDLTVKLSNELYYRQLFTKAFGDELISEKRMQEALAQFVRSIQSFDSKYDIGRAMVNNDNQQFPNFTTLENEGKNLFSRNAMFQGQSGNRIGGGLGCQGCHRTNEFDIAPNSRNNGVVLAADLTTDLSITKSPTLRDMFNPAGELNGQLMHNGDFESLEMVLGHYNSIEASGNNNLDARLGRGGGQQLNMTEGEKLAVIAFLKTLSGKDVYENEKWSDPFSE
jgi:cytochrome c peroxidase